MTLWLVVQEDGAEHYGTFYQTKQAATRAIAKHKYNCYGPFPVKATRRGLTKMAVLNLVCALRSAVYA